MKFLKSWTLTLLGLASLIGVFTVGARANVSNTTAPAATPIPEPKVKYKAGKDLNFEELIIQGQLKRPEVSVVTGDTRQGGFGLLRMRENFVDHTTADLGEEIQ